jgi:ribosomal protein S18 acetylase RimI-like enzyme
MHIVTAAESHAEAIAALHSASWAATYNDVLSADYLASTVPQERQQIWRDRLGTPRRNQVVLVAEDGDQLIGFTCLYLAEHAEWGSYLDNLHVSHAWQGQGIGKQLLLAAAQVSEAHHPGLGLYLLVNQTNQRAQGFYQAHGAYNAQASVWNAPDGSTVPTFIFRWPRAAALVGQA